MSALKQLASLRGPKLEPSVETDDRGAGYGVPIRHTAVLRVDLSDRVERVSRVLEVRFPTPLSAEEAKRASDELAEIARIVGAWS